MTKNRIVVGVEGSKGATEALRWALSEAQIRSCKVDIVTAYAPTFVASATDFNYAPLEPLDIKSEIEKMQAEVLEDARAGSDNSVEVECHILRGRPADTLIRASEEADLLIVGSRGRGGFKGLKLGSVSQQIVQHGNCPVVIIRAKD